MLIGPERVMHVWDRGAFRMSVAIPRGYSTLSLIYACRYSLFPVGFDTIADVKARTGRCCSFCSGTRLSAFRRVDRSSVWRRATWPSLLSIFYPLPLVWELAPTSFGCPMHLAVPPAARSLIHFDTFPRRLGPYLAIECDAFGCRLAFICVAWYSDSLCVE